MKAMKLLRSWIRIGLKWTCALVLALSGLPGVGISTVHAAHPVWYVKQDARSRLGDSWENAASLQWALGHAGPEEQIWVTAGVYKPATNADRNATFQLKAFVAVYGGFTGSETRLDQRDWLAHPVTLSGDLNGDDTGFSNNAENSYHVVIGADKAVLDGFTIRGGNANAASGLAQFGGGMLNESCSPVLHDINFTGNAAVEGGGLFDDASSSPMITEVGFNNNQAVAGGGVFNQDHSSPTLTSVYFVNNSGTNSGGGMINSSASSPTLTFVTFQGNTTPGDGAGMLNDSNSNPALLYVVFSGNIAVSNGGGMFELTSSSTLNNVTFDANQAEVGAGMYINESSPTLTNVTFSGNTALYLGAAIASQVNSSPVLTHVTISGNSAPQQGGLSNYGNSHPLVRNSILWGDSGGEVYNDATSTAGITASDVQGGYTGAGNFNADPLLSPLGDYGGPVQTGALLPCSPAIDAASSSCPAADARGVARPSLNCDLGAFESQGFTLAISGGDNQSGRLHTAFAHPLAVSVTAKDTHEPVDGGKITFIPPASGASAVLPGSPAFILTGLASTNAVANGTTGGPYTVSAAASGAVRVVFHLKNVYGWVYLPLVRK